MFVKTCKVSQVTHTFLGFTFHLYIHFSNGAVWSQRPTAPSFTKLRIRWGSNSAIKDLSLISSPSYGYKLIPPKHGKSSKMGIQTPLLLGWWLSQNNTWFHIWGLSLEFRPPSTNMMFKINLLNSVPFKRCVEVSNLCRGIPQNLKGWRWSWRTPPKIGHSESPCQNGGGTGKVTGKRLPKLGKTVTFWGAVCCSTSGLGIFDVFFFF